MLAGFGIRPDFKRADLGESRAKLDRHQPLAGLPEPQHRVERRVKMQIAVRLVLGELHHFAGLVLGPCARAVQAKRNRLVRQQLQIARVELHRRSFLGAPRHQAQSAQSIAVAAAQSDEIRPGETAAHQQPRASGSHVGIIRCAHGDRQIQVAILKDRGPPAVPVLHHVRHALAQNLRDKKAAVEQDRVGSGIARGGEKCRQVPRHCRISDVR